MTSIVNNFNKPPFGIDPVYISSFATFKIQIPDADIARLASLLELLPLPKENFETSRGGWEYGVQRNWIAHAVDYWQSKFDWHKQEAALNTFPQFKAAVQSDDGHEYKIHFAALFSKKKDAVPIVISHGWPGSFIEAVPILQELVTRYESAPDELPYHIIAPSLVGFGFSSPPPIDKSFSLPENATLIHRLMLGLGFGHQGYMATGGDLGTWISATLVDEYDECKAAHFNLWLGYPEVDPAKHPSVTDVAANDVLGPSRRHKDFLELGYAYSKVHATKPGTIGIAIGNSPISLLAWMGEKFVAWSDPRTIPSLDTILTNVSLYWFTDTFHTSIWGYLQFRPGHELSKARPVSGKPTGFSGFPYEIYSTPPASYFQEHKIYQHVYLHDKGGHFAYLEQPMVLLADIEDFITKVF